MKKLFFISIVSALVLGFVSCDNSEDSEVTPGNLVGMWQGIHAYELIKEDGEIVDEYDEDVDLEEYDYRYVFEEDGSGFDGFFEDGERTRESDDFTWELSGNTLTLDYDGFEDKYTVEQLTSTRLVLSATYRETEDGVTYEEFSRATFAKIK
jgi:hypothetical protein